MILFGHGPALRDPAALPAFAAALPLGLGGRHPVGVRDPRDVDWEGCLNARDLGGLPAAGGRRTRWGAVVRADAPDHLTAAGWAAVRAHGVRTVVDLRNEDELGARRRPAPGRA